MSRSALAVLLTSLTACGAPAGEGLFESRGRINAGTSGGNPGLDAASMGGNAGQTPLYDGSGSGGSSSGGSGSGAPGPGSADTSTGGNGAPGPSTPLDPNITPEPGPSSMCGNGNPCTDYFEDRDRDGFGVEGEKRCLCEPEGFFTATQGGDCRDGAEKIHPGATELCNGLDDNCNRQIDEGAGCPCERREFQGGSYLFCTRQATWYHARERCSALGYHLVTINDADENYWLSVTAREVSEDNFWMGMNDLEEEGRWVWVDGSAVGYTNWNLETNEPNNAQEGGEHCGRINRFWPLHTWDDGQCHNLYPTICEAR